MLLGALFTLIGTMTVTGSWDDRYRAAIEQIGRGNDRSATVLVNQLSHLVDIWHRAPSYIVVRREVAGIAGPVEAQIRVEFGTVAGTTYEVIWIVQVANNVTLLSNTNGKLHSEALPYEEWKRLVQTVAQVRGWTQPSAADYATNDGTAFFVSIWLPEGVGQFAIYAPVLGTSGSSAEQEEFRRRTAVQDRIVRQILEIAGVGR
jgi:hypothetical protein